MSGFMTAVNASMDDGIKAYRKDRAENPHLTDEQFIRRFGQTLALAVNLGTLNGEELAYRLAAAMHRLATHECRRDGETCHD